MNGLIDRAPAKKKRPEAADILRAHHEEFLRDHTASAAQRKIIRHIMDGPRDVV